MENKMFKRKSPSTSAFAIYSSSLDNAKREKPVCEKGNIELKSLTSHKSITKSSKTFPEDVSCSQKTFDNETAKAKEESGSIMKNFSNKAKVTLKRKSMKSKKKLKKKNILSQIQCPVYRSIELSTSHSLVGFEETGPGNTISKTNQPENHTSTSGNNKVEKCVEQYQSLKSDCKINGNDIERTSNNKIMNGKEKNLENSTNSSYTTVSTKAKNIPKMPFPEGNSEKDGETLLQWLIHPFGLKKFFDDVWEKKPLLIYRHTSNYTEGLFSSDEFNRILNECNVRFDVNLDVTTYQNGVRETHNTDGRAYAPVVWDYYNNGCSVRLKNPQSFSKPVWKLCSTLQEHFKSMVGANIYLTPAGTQGFAPHYDDIEAFVLQLEGCKRWTVYNPRKEQETLPRYSSKNFEQSEIGTKILETTLSPGDLLYFPRGYIHQARSLPNDHSLHITISTYQKNSWADFLELLIPTALSRAISEDVRFRRGLPLNFLSLLGVQNSDKDVQERKELIHQVSSLIRRLSDFIDLDAAADIRGIAFLHDALPPVFSEEERKRSILGADVKIITPGRPSACLCHFSFKTKIRIVRKNALRLCVNNADDCDDTSTVRVYHSIQNSRVYHEEEEKYFEMDVECAPAVEYLIHSYPNYVSISSLPMNTGDEKINLATSLFEKGILVTEKEIKLTNSS